MPPPEPGLVLVLGLGAAALSAVVCCSAPPAPPAAQLSTPGAGATASAGSAGSAGGHSRRSERRLSSPPPLPRTWRPAKAGSPTTKQTSWSPQQAASESAALTPASREGSLELRRSPPGMNSPWKHLREPGDADESASAANTTQRLQAPRPRAASPTPSRAAAVLLEAEAARDLLQRTKSAAASIELLQDLREDIAAVHTTRDTVAEVASIFADGPIGVAPSGPSPAMVRQAAVSLLQEQQRTLEDLRAEVSKLQGALSVHENRSTAEEKAEAARPAEEHENAPQRSPLRQADQQHAKREWKEGYDVVCNKPYWHNRRTKETRWQREQPPHAPPSCGSPNRHSKSAAFSSSSVDPMHVAHTAAKVRAEMQREEEESVRFAERQKSPVRRPSPLRQADLQHGEHGTPPRLGGSAFLAYSPTMDADEPGWNPRIDPDSTIFSSGDVNEELSGWRGDHAASELDTSGGNGNGDRVANGSKEKRRSVIDMVEERATADRQGDYYAAPGARSWRFTLSPEPTEPTKPASTTRRRDSRLRGSPPLALATPEVIARLRREVYVAESASKALRPPVISPKPIRRPPPEPDPGPSRGYRSFLPEDERSEVVGRRNARGLNRSGTIVLQERQPPPAAAADRPRRGPQRGVESLRAEKVSRAPVESGAGVMEDVRQSWQFAHVRKSPARSQRPISPPGARSWSFHTSFQDQLDDDEDVVAQEVVGSEPTAGRDRSRRPNLSPVKHWTEAPQWKP